MKKQKTPATSKASSGEAASSYHVPVLLTEVMEGMALRPDGVYVDCTFGGGGHSRAILEKLNDSGKLIAFDQDADAKQNLPDDPRVLFIPQNFRHLQRFLKLNGITRVSGILADLGVSSHQFDVAERGFSTRFEGAIDMRMDQRQESKASDILNRYTEQELHQIFEKLGEVTNSKTLAKRIVEVRGHSPFQNIDGLKRALESIVKGNPKKYFAQVFQALRMEVNDELGALKEMLMQVPDVLESGGRIAVITFHSIEDRVVKQFFRDNSFDLPEDHPFENVEKNIRLKPVNKKPITAGQEETRLNPRSRSAKLRIAERI